MKKIVLIAAMAALLGACTVAEKDNAGKAGSSALNFSSAFERTKVGMTESGGKFAACWSQGDTVGIFCSAGGDNYPYWADVDSSALSCTFYALDFKRYFTCASADCMYYAYWPYSEGNPSSSNVTFTIPSVQNQKNGGSDAHLASLMPFVASPCQVKASEGDAHLQFSPLFSIVEFGLKMDKPTESPVLVRQISLISGNGPLAANVSCDITQSSPALSYSAAAGRIDLKFGSDITVCSSSEQKAYMVAAPDSYDGLELDVTAVNGSVATVSLPKATFKQGENYYRSISLSPDDFKAGESFSVSAASKEVSRGIPVRFELKGSAQSVVLYSGEEYHSYKYAKEERKIKTATMMSFMNALSDGNQPKCTSVKVSTDFSGEMNESSILAAKWTDISSMFTMPSSIPGSANPLSNKTNYDSYFVPSGDTDIVSCFGDSNRIYVAFFYHIDKYEAAKSNARTGSYITKLKVGNGYTMSKENIHLVAGKSMSGVMQQPGWMTPSSGVPADPCFRLFTDKQPSAGRDAYAVSSAISPEYINKGLDQPFIVKRESDSMPASYEYTFNDPGKYEVVFVAATRDIFGKAIEEAHKIEIVVK